MKIDMTDWTTEQKARQALHAYAGMQGILGALGGGGDFLDHFAEIARAYLAQLREIKRLRAGLTAVVKDAPTEYEDGMHLGTCYDEADLGRLREHFRLAQIARAALTVIPPSESPRSGYDEDAAEAEIEETQYRRRQQGIVGEED